MRIRVWYKIRVWYRTATPNNMAGYNYEFVDKVENRLLCKLCKLTSRNPYLSVCCGKLFCNSCLYDVKTVVSACPVCHDKKFIIFKQTEAEQTIKSLHVYCTNKVKGCEWQGELNNINNHLGNSDGCQFEEVKCSIECGKMIERRYLTSHVETECPCRKVNCQYCHDTGEHQFIEGQHKEECPKLPLPCPNKCEVGSVPREDMEAHRKECPLEMIQCKYHNVGCEVRMARKDQENHKKENMEEHLMKNNLALIGIKQTLNHTKNKVNITKSELENTKDELKNIKVELKNTNDELKNTKVELKNTSDELKNTKDELKNTKVELESTKDELKNTKDELTNIKDELTNTNDELNNNKDELKDFKDELLSSTKVELKITEDKVNDTRDELNSTKVELKNTIDQLRLELTDTKCQLVNAVATLTEMNNQLDGVLQHVGRLQHYTSLGIRLARPTSGAAMVDSFLEWLVAMAVMSESGDQQCPVIMRLEVNKQKDNNIEYYSNPFFTHDKGYKMCLLINPSGYGDGKGTHLSCSLCLMKGPHDDRLTWPLREIFEVKLLNQISDSHHHSFTVTFDDATPDDISGRVTEDGTATGWGIHEFISNEDLYKTTTTCQFLKDECRLFQVTKYKA